MSTDGELAAAYSASVLAAEVSALSAEPEAQLTVPVAVLLEALAAGHNVGTLKLLREAQLIGVRPDFAATIGGRPCGWVELKAPGHSMNGDKWTGREKKQWALLRELDALLISNGEDLVLYHSGVIVGDPAPMPYSNPGVWDSAPLIELLQLFVASRPATVTRPSQLAEKLAPLARMLRDRIATGLLPATPSQPIQQAKTAWATHIHEHVTDAGFADDLAQVISYSMAIAALRGDADTDGDHFVTLDEARNALRQSNEVLAAAIGPALDIPGLSKALSAEIGAIERLASAVDAEKIAKAKDARGEAWLWFYEDFLAAYDPERRKASGVYYTPTDVVQLQVRLVDSILREKLGRKLSFGHKSVVTLDPATGSGTYPLAVLDRAAKIALDQRGLAGPAQIAPTLATNVIAFEILPGPYAVAHLRIGQRLAELANQLVPPGHVRVYLTDTLDDPSVHVQPLDLWGDVAVLAAERARAATVKSEQAVTAIIGNPPYNRRDAESGGGWVLHPATGRPLFEDVIEPAKAAGVIFSAMRSVYDDYVYFWRWALWKAFEQRPDQPAVISFITSATWLSGPAFVGLRELARKHADEMWVIDLGGQGRGANKDENVFAIQTPVAIVTMYRSGKSKPSPSSVSYRHVIGTRAQKLEALRLIEAPSGEGDGWTAVEAAAAATLIPGAGGADWDAMPALTDLFPWQQPGSILARAWPVAPAADVLKARWTSLLSDESADARAAKFVQAKTGRNVHSSPWGKPSIASLPAGTDHEPIVRYAYRSFDRQWTFEDPRVAKTESPSLWQSRSPKQIFLTSIPTGRLGPGPALVPAIDVPDFHHFNNRGGKDVMPLYRDAAATQPNLPAGLLTFLADAYGFSVNVEDVAAYVAALLAHPGYQARFAVELTTPGPHVPLTADAGLFARVRDVGARALWLQTFGERFRAPAAGRGEALPSVPGLGWAAAVTTMPASEEAIVYDAATTTLHVGDGAVEGVSPEVWAYSVTPYPILPRWVGLRTGRGVGRAASKPKPLDLIRPTEWDDEWNDELLDLVRMLTASIALHPEQAALLEEVLGGPLLAADQLPQPTAAERAVPSTVNGEQLDDVDAVDAQDPEDGIESE